MMYLFVIYLDTLMTLIGTHQPGFSEANPILRDALVTGDFKLALLSTASVLLVMLLVIKCWNIKIGKLDRHHLSRTSRVLRLTAWLLVPAYFYFTSFVWMYMLTYNSSPPFYEYFLAALEKIL